MASQDRELAEEVDSGVLEEEPLDQVDEETSDQLNEDVERLRWWKRLFGEISDSTLERLSLASHLASGGVSGWCVGRLFQKVGLVAPAAVGGGFVLFKLAKDSGYTKVAMRNIRKARRLLENSVSQAGPEINNFVQKTTALTKKTVVSNGFIGGFLLGMFVSRSFNL